MKKEKKNIKKNLFFLGAIASFVFFSFLSGAVTAFADTASTPTVSNGASGTVTDTSCLPDAASLAKIQVIQNDPTLSALSEIKSELAVRKSLLLQTISCAKQEEKSLRTTLASTTSSTVDPGFQSLQNQLISNLDQAGDYYDIQITKVNTAGISGTKAIAKDILAWRESNYAPIAANASNFILWSHNQPLFNAADNRLMQVKTLAQSVAFSGNTQFQTDFQQALVSLQAAEKDNTQAKQALSQSLPSSDSLTLIEQSLNALSSTYQHFFDISSLAETLLPH